MIMMGDKKRAVNAILGNHEPEETNEAANALESCAQELIDCVHAKDSAGVVSAFRAMFQEMEREPHEESDHG